MLPEVAVLKLLESFVSTWSTAEQRCEDEGYTITFGPDVCVCPPCAEKQTLPRADAELGPNQADDQRGDEGPLSCQEQPLQLDRG